MNIATEGRADKSGLVCGYEGQKQDKRIARRGKGVRGNEVPPTSPCEFSTMKLILA